jgi:hypothetical protein
MTRRDVGPRQKVEPRPPMHEQFRGSRAGLCFPCQCLAAILAERSQKQPEP